MPGTVDSPKGCLYNLRDSRRSKNYSHKFKGKVVSCGTALILRTGPSCGRELLRGSLAADDSGGGSSYIGGEYDEII